MMQLSQYVADTQSLINDQQGILVSLGQLQRWINEARRITCIATGCLNYLVSGQSPFGNQSNPNQLIPGGAQPGSDVATSFMTVPNQEKYPYSLANVLLRSIASGADSVIDVNSVAVSWGSMRPALDYMTFPDLQAYARSYSYLVTSYPLVWSKDGDGEVASMWMFPVPTQALEMEWNVSATPRDLFLDSDPDALPYSFQLAVKFYAAYLGNLTMQRYGIAEAMLGQWASRLGMTRYATEKFRVTRNYEYGTI